MKNIVKKLLVTTAAFIVMSGSLGVGTLKVLAEQVEQYYGWNDIESRSESPYFLYVTPTNDPKRELKDEYVVYCFNRDREWPENWENYVPKPDKLPVYYKLQGTDEAFKNTASKFRATIKNVTGALVAVLEKGFPTVKQIEGLNEESSRKVTQLAIWYFSDSFDKSSFKVNYKLSNEEENALYTLITAGEAAASKEISEEGRTLDIYITTDKNYAQKPYQNLLGSTLIPKKEVPKEPENPKTPEQPTPAPQPESPKEEDLGTTIGGGNVVETEEVLSGEQGQSGSTTEVEDTKGPDVIIGDQGQVIETEESLSGEQGQSGSTTEVEDTKSPDVMIGGQGQVIETEESLSGEQGQSGSTTEVEDTKGPDVIIGGQGQVIETEEILSGEQGQSGSTTEVEDSKPKVSIHFDNDKPKEEKPEFPKVDTPKAKVTLPATGDAKQAMLTFVGAMLIFLLSLLALFRWKASKA